MLDWCLRFRRGHQIITLKSGSQTTALVSPEGRVGSRTSIVVVCLRSDCSQPLWCEQLRGLLLRVLLLPGLIDLVFVRVFSVVLVLVLPVIVRFHSVRQERVWVGRDGEVQLTLG